jgi:DNA repair protein RecN (Recombination protein N)
MLTNLTISNFALIEHLRLDWTKGLNVLIGETGAGKSIIIDALSTLLGAKAGPSVIRSGKEKANIEGIFSANSNVMAWLKTNELVDDAGDEIVVSREVTKAGSRFRINGTLVNQQLVQEVRQLLFSVHAQHEARTLLSSQTQLDLLDSMADKGHQKLVEKVRTIYERKRDLSLQLNELRISEEERLRRIDFARFQLNELNEAHLAEENEDEALMQQERVLTNFTLLEDQTALAQDNLTGGDHDSEKNCALDMLQHALSELDKAVKFDADLEPISTLLLGSLASAEEASKLLRRYRDGLETDPETLNIVQGRLALLSTIKKKYGPALKDAIERVANLENDLEQLQNAQVRAESIESELNEATAELSRLSIELTEKRKKLAKQLAVKLQEELSDLGMERCRIEINFECMEEPGLSGQDRVEFLIAPNPGQPIAPLAKIASGGELSRIMLAIKTIFAGADKTPTVVFDEIDTGLSGKTLQAMRDKLMRLSKSHQILCITHQAILAAVADNHVYILKQHLDEDTIVSARVLNADERVKALAGMASGYEDGEVAINFAQSLIDQAKQVRSA